MSYNYTITSKGQITLPKHLRDAIGLKTGDKARIELLDDRTIVIKSPLDIDAIRRSVGRPSNKQPLTNKEKLRISARGL